MNKAWHLRQDGKAFPVKVHLYCMGDEDLSSEAEVASFIINTNSQDQDIAEYVLDAWMSLLIEEEVSYDADSEAIDRAIREAVMNTGYKFAYPLSPDKLIDIHHKQDNYSDLDTLYEFTDDVRYGIEKLQDKIKKSLNQQFCRVRYGGQYNSLSGNNGIWFRVSSVAYNWANTIYEFVSNNRRSYRIDNVTICRDSESDGGFDSKEEYFYKAKDGTLYKNLPIDEYLQEEHEHNPVFEATIQEGVLCTIRKKLMNGETYNTILKFLEGLDLEYSKDVWEYFKKIERKRCIREDKMNFRSN